MNIINNYDNVILDIKNACSAAGTDATKVKLLLVTKYASIDDISLLLSNRKVEYVAESRLQDSLKKWAHPDLAGFKVKKFFIGQLQTNKVAKVLQNFDVICSVDSLKLAKVIDEQAAKTATKASCMVQIKLTDRLTQGGVDLNQADSFIKSIKADFTNISLQGIMAIAPIAENPQDLAPLFEQVKKLFDNNFTDADYLSLGMSGDFKVAVQHGSNLPRIGSAIFS